MRALVLALVAILVGPALPAGAEESPGSNRPLSETLPLFEKNHCADIRDPADQLFCGDPELGEASKRMAPAVQGRLDRVLNHRAEIADNAGWIRNRNSSCGIFGSQGVRMRDFPSVKSCLLLETEERIAMLSDPNFDCLTTNTGAELLICSDAALAIADMELTGLTHDLIRKLRDRDATDAFEEYARWTRTRDRRCGLENKDNVPLEELGSSVGCLSEFIAQKTTEMAAAKGDPKRVFGRHLPPATADADAVDQCVAQIHSANNCSNFLAVDQIVRIDRDITASAAQVRAKVEMTVMSPFTVCSQIALACTGTCWDSKTANAKVPANRQSLSIAQKLAVTKSFAFTKIEGGWRCDTSALQPVDEANFTGR